MRLVFYRRRVKGRKERIEVRRRRTLPSEPGNASECEGERGREKDRHNKGREGESVGVKISVKECEGT